LKLWSFTRKSGLEEVKIIPHKIPVCLQILCYINFGVQKTDKINVSGVRGKTKKIIKNLVIGNRSKWPPNPHS
jgi:hypothetical protein